MNRFQSKNDAIVIGMVNPMQGPLGIIGPSARMCAELAAEEINQSGGILGREVQLKHLDGGASIPVIQAEVTELIRSGLVQAVAGVHTSAVRQALAATVGSSVPYIYNSLYEGGEQMQGLFVTGETPEYQLLPALTLLGNERSIDRWALIGNDYIWPRRTAETIRSHLIATKSGALVAEMFTPLGACDFGAVLDRLSRSRATGVIVLLVGQDAVEFHRQYAARGLHGMALRVTPLMDENMVLAAGAQACEDLFVGAGYFSSLHTADNFDFISRYAHRFGVDSPIVGTMAESCYEGLYLLAALAQSAGTLDVAAVQRLSDTLVYECARGVQRLDRGHSTPITYLAGVDGLEFDVLTELTPVPLA